MNKEIKEIDIEIIDLVAKRVELYKNDLNNRSEKDKISILDEEDLIKKIIKEKNPGILDDLSYERIFNEIISNSIYSVIPQKVSFLGPEGTFTNLALNEIFSGSVKKIPQKTIADVFRSVMFLDLWKSVKLHLVSSLLKIVQRVLLLLLWMS